MPTFFDVYREELLASVKKCPGEYALLANETAEAYATRTADKMIAAMRRDKGVEGVNTNTQTFRRVCKRLGIKNNQKTMSARVQSEL